MTKSEAERACDGRNNAFLPRVTNSRVQDKLRDFRAASGGSSFWIDVYAVSVSSRFYWLDGSTLAGLLLLSRVTFAELSPSMIGCIPVKF